MKLPYLINLHVLHFYVADASAHDLFALLASNYQKLQDRIAVQFGDAFRAANTGTFKQKFQRKDGFVHRHRHRA